MDAELVDRLKEEMRAEFARTAPPDGFPAFHDIPIGRHTSDEFWLLEQEHLWPTAWVLAGRAEDVAERRRLLPVRLARRPDDPRARQGPRPARVLQHVPAPWRAGRARAVGHCSPAALPVPLVDVRHHRRRTRERAGRTRLRRPRQDAAVPAVDPLRGLGRLGVRQPGRRRGAAARVARTRSPISWRSSPGLRCAPSRRAARSSRATGRSPPRRSSRCTTSATSTAATARAQLDNRGATMGLLPNGAVTDDHAVLEVRVCGARDARLGRLPAPHRARVRRHPDRQRHGPLHEQRVLRVPEPDHADRRLRLPVHHVLADRPTDHAHRVDALRARSTSSRPTVCRRTGRSGWRSSTRSCRRTSRTWPRCSARSSRRRCAESRSTTRSGGSGTSTSSSTG